MEKGLIRGKKAPFNCGLNRCWSFQEKDIAECVRRRPWLVDINRILNDVGYRSYFRQIIREEWARDPWYTAREAAPLLGVSNHDPVLRYINRGWLKAEKRPVNIDGEWIIRKSVIDGFLTSGVREKHRHETASLYRHNLFLRRTYMERELTVKDCPSPESPNGRHRWDIDGNHHGRCVYPGCGVERDFSPIADPHGRDRLRPEDRKVIDDFLTERRRERLKRSKEAKEVEKRMTLQQIPGSSDGETIIAAVPPVSAMPAEISERAAETGGKAASGPARLGTAALGALKLEKATNTTAKSGLGIKKWREWDRHKNEILNDVQAMGIGTARLKWRIWDADWKQLKERWQIKLIIRKGRKPKIVYISPVKARKKIKPAVFRGHDVKPADPLSPGPGRAQGNKVNAAAAGYR